MRLPILLCALVLLPLTPPAAAQQDMVVVRDPVTGELRAPTAAELRALRQATPDTARTPAQQPGTVVRPDGTRVLKLREGDMSYSVVRRDQQGLHEHCVQGEAAAQRALEGAKEQDHETH